MSRDYRIIHNGKFVGPSFNSNVAGSIYLGLIMKNLGMPYSEHFGMVGAPHEITGEIAEGVRLKLKDPLFAKNLRKAIEAIPNRRELSSGPDEEDVIWATEFFNMALNPEGFASDYCEEYH